MGQCEKGGREKYIQSVHVKLQCTCTCIAHHCESTNEVVDVFPWSLGKHSALDTKQILWEIMRKGKGREGGA